MYAIGMMVLQQSVKGFETFVFFMVTLLSGYVVAFI